MNTTAVTLLLDCYGALQLWRGHQQVARKYTTGNIYHAAATGQPCDILLQDTQDIADVMRQLSQDEQHDLERGWPVRTTLYEAGIPLPYDDLFERVTILQVGRAWHIWRGHRRIIRTRDRYVDRTSGREADLVTVDPGVQAQISHKLPNNAVDMIESGYATEVSVLKDVIPWKKEENHA